VLIIPQLFFSKSCDTIYIFSKTVLITLFQTLVAMWRAHGQTVIPRQTWGLAFSPWRKVTKTLVSRQKLSRKSARKVMLLYFFLSVIFVLNVSVWVLFWACFLQSDYQLHFHIYHCNISSRYFIKLKFNEKKTIARQKWSVWITHDTSIFFTFDKHLVLHHSCKCLPS
jgi:hypothetical protein